MPDKRDAIAEDLRRLADDLRSLLESITTDPRKRRRREQQWKQLDKAMKAVTMIVAAKVAARVWTILTGEEPPTKKGGKAKPPSPASRAPEHEEAPTAT
jgi:hypothetical protein